MIYTSYFGKLRKIPEEIVRFNICLYPPGFAKNYRTIKLLCPSPSDFALYKDTRDEVRFSECYNAQLLDLQKTLPPKEVERQLYLFSSGLDIVLLCFEKPGDLCHRHLLRKWLNDGGVECKEWGSE